MHLLWRYQLRITGIYVYAARVSQYVIDAKIELKKKIIIILALKFYGTMQSTFKFTGDRILKINIVVLKLVLV